jgi:hypothetical protein
LKLEELRTARKISFWSIIKHKPEDDEAGKKEHFHVYIEPASQLQTDDLKQELIELYPGEEKPRKCLTFNSSNFGNWYMYGLHDKRYLASKGQSRRFHYTAEDFGSSDDDELLFRVRSIDLISLSPYADMLAAQEQGLSFNQYFARGTIPILQVKQFENAWQLLLYQKTERNGRPGHDCVDENGEIIDED